MPEREIPWLRIAVVAVLGAAVTGVILIVRGAGALPDAVQPIAWNRQPCAHCQMLIGEPRHAAQLITEGGAVLSFDDPGCALRYVDGNRPAIHRMWFHHATAERWLPSGEVAFVTGARTPMGSGLAAVERGAPASIDLAAARRVANAPDPHALGGDAAAREGAP